jgi:hypothetical protein
MDEKGTWQDSVRSNNDKVHSLSVRAISAISAIMLAATFTYLERRVGLRLQAEGNNFQHLL